MMAGCLYPATIHCVLTVLGTPYAVESWSKETVTTFIPDLYTKPLRHDEGGKQNLNAGLCEPKSCAFLTAIDEESQ